MPRAMSVCSCLGCEAHPGSCPTVTPGRRCPPCDSAREKRRGTRQARGYDAPYLRARDRAVTGATHCSTCHEPFTEDNPATGGHSLAIRHGGTTADGVVAECARCNYGWRKTGS